MGFKFGKNEIRTGKFVRDIIVNYKLLIAQEYSKKEAYELAFKTAFDKLERKLTKEESNDVCSRLEKFRNDEDIYGDDICY